MKDFVIAVAEIIEGWFPNLEWEDIMDIVTTENEYSRRAQEIVRSQMK